MTQPEFLGWVAFFNQHPTLIAHLLEAAPAAPAAPAVAASEELTGWTAADLATFKAMGMKPPRKV